MTWRDELDTEASAFERRLVDEAIYAYEDWLEECVRVRDSYERWSRASGFDRSASFAAYLSALDAEQLAANVFREAASRLRRTALLHA